MQVKRKALVAIVVVLVAAAGLATTLLSAHANPRFAGSEVPRYQHIFVVMMENHSYDEVIGNANAPAINALANEYGLATDYFGVTHPSEPNYVASIGGSYFGIQDDNAYTTHTLNAPSLASQLESAGLTWKTYQQSIPSTGYTGTRWPLSGPTLYAAKHNPFLNFASIQNSPTELRNIVPDTQLVADLAGDTPNFAFIAPDQCHDMHGTSTCSDNTALIQAGDAYVADVVRTITSSRVWREGNNAIVIVWDEDDFAATNLGCCDANPGGGHVAAVVVTNHGPRHVQDATPYNHYSLLETIQDAFHLGCLQNTCDTANVKPMTPLFSGSDD